MAGTLAMTLGARIRNWWMRLRGERLLRFATGLFVVIGAITVSVHDRNLGSNGTGVPVTVAWTLENPIGFWFLIALLIMGAVTILYRGSNPLIVLLIGFIELFMGTVLPLGVQSHMQIFLFVAIYLCIRLPMYLQAVCDALIISVMIMHYVRPSLLRPWYSLILGLFFIVATVSSVLSIALERRTMAGRLQEVQKEAAVLSLEKQQAERRSGMINELHDSVGHGLTSIIALSQGGQQWVKEASLMDSPIMDVLGEITAIARENLNQTRRILAVFDDNQSHELLGTGLAEPVIQQPGLRLRDWDDIRPILEHARSTGIVVVFTETGRRADDPRRADLCFAITREAVTNAMRYGQGLSRIAVAWDHDDTDGHTMVTVRNDGASSKKDHDEARRPSSYDPSGSGLKRLGERVEKANGTLKYGPSGNGWTVCAVIP